MSRFHRDDRFFPGGIWGRLELPTNTPFNSKPSNAPNPGSDASAEKKFAPGPSVGSVWLETRMSEATPEQLLDAVSRGCERSLSSLYDEFSPALFGIALGVTRNRAEAQEVLQDAFVAIWNKAGQYDPALGKASTWIIHLTRNLAIDALRKRQRRDNMMTRAGAEPEQKPPADDPASPLIAAETAARVRQALATLPDDQRAAVELAFFEGFTQTEISEKLELPLGTIKSRIRRALERVRRVLTELKPNDR